MVFNCLGSGLLAGNSWEFPEVVLETDQGDKKATHELVALNRESYVVIRCGVEAEQGQPGCVCWLVAAPMLPS